MATHGNIEAFDRSMDDWTAYCERLEQYFAANDVADADKKHAILLSYCGAPTYRLIRTLLAPVKPTTKSFAELTKLVADHYTPPPSMIVQRFQFNSRSQKEGESIAEFVADLRRISEHCKYENVLDDMLRDRLVCGIQDVSVQRRLLAEPDLTFKKAMELAQTAEMASKNAKQLQNTPSNPPNGSVHALNTTQHQQRRAPPTGSRDQTCYRCGNKHASSECRFKNATCNFCHKKGHIAKVCQTKAKQVPVEQPRPVRSRHSQRTNNVTEEPETEDSTYHLFTVTETHKKKVVQSWSQLW